MIDEKSAVREQWLLRMGCRCPGDYPLVFPLVGDLGMHRVRYLHHVACPLRKGSR